MSEITFSKQFFVNLFAMVQMYGTIYIVTDGNHYRDKESAVNRCKDALRVGKIKKYACITIDNFPDSEAELKSLLTTVELGTTTVEKAKENPRSVVFDTEAAEKALKTRSKKSKKEVDE